MPMLATRGCPFSCTFCTSPNMWTNLWLPRDPKKVVDEMELYIQKYDVTDFQFEDLTAIVRKDWIEAFCQEILDRGMMPAMEEFGDRFSRGEAFLPELLLAADTMKGAMEELESVIKEGEITPKATLLLGTVEGDIHDLGKNLVKMMFEGAGFKVIDIGIE